MPSLASRLDVLEGEDGEWVMIRQCPACGAMVPGPEAIYLGTDSPPCTRGQPHGPIPAPSPRDIVLKRAYGLKE